MNLGTGSRASWVLAVGTALALAAAGARSQAPPGSADAPLSDEAIEEIVVHGSRSYARLRYEFFQAERAFFAAFNSLNSNDAFDVRCEYVVDLGSRRRRQLCMPEFARDAEGRANREMMAGADMMGVSGGMQPASVDMSRYNVSGYANRRELRKQDERLREELLELLATHPEFRKSLAELVDARRLVESAEER